MCFWLGCSPRFPEIDRTHRYFWKCVVIFRILGETGPQIRAEAENNEKKRAVDLAKVPSGCVSGTATTETPVKMDRFFWGLKMMLKVSHDMNSWISWILFCKLEVVSNWLFNFASFLKDKMVDKIIYICNEHSFLVVCVFQKQLCHKNWCC